MTYWPDTGLLSPPPPLSVCYQCKVDHPRDSTSAVVVRHRGGGDVYTDEDFACSAHVWDRVREGSDYGILGLRAL